MRTTYLAIATSATILLALTTFARAEQAQPEIPPMANPFAVERALEGPVQGDYGDPLGLLWDNPFDAEIIIKDGLVYT